MGKKMSLTSLKKMSLTSFFKPRDHHNSCTKSTVSSWSWPSCKQQPKTLSFRAGHDMLKMVNSGYLVMASDEVDSPFSYFTSSSECPFLMSPEEYSTAGESTEAILRGLQSDRLFYEQMGESKCMVEKAIDHGHMILDHVIPNKEYVVLAMDSKDPYKDFRSSMEEVVEAHGMMEWDCLEELLLWYLKMNGKKTHRYIVGAFVHLIVEIVASNLEKLGIDHEDDDLSDLSFDYQGKDFHAR